MSPSGVYIRTDWHKKITSNGLLGNIPWNKGLKGWNKGHITSEETRKKISEAHKGKISPFKGMTIEDRYGDRAEIIKRKWLQTKKKNYVYKPMRQEWKEKIRLANTGKKRTVEHKLKYSKCKLGVKHSPETIEKLRTASSWYIDGRTPFRQLFEMSILYKNWVNKIFTRDNWTCQECYRRGKKEDHVYLNAHHIKRLSVLLTDFFNQYSQFSPIEDKETLLRLSTSYQPFWEIANGKTLCWECHIKFHKMENIHE